jgi:hypothetical protein
VREGIMYSAVFQKYYICLGEDLEIPHIERFERVIQKKL